MQQVPQMQARQLHAPMQAVAPIPRILVPPVQQGTLPMPPYDPSLTPVHQALLDDWTRICAAYQHTQICAHSWFVDSGRPRWVPAYSFAADTLLAAVWREWHEGVNGTFSIEALTDGWGTAWRGNAKSVYSKRARVIAFIRKLKRQRAWSTDQAIRYLNTLSTQPWRCTALYQQLAQPGKEQALLDQAAKRSG